MAKQTLPVNFTDDNLSDAMGGLRRYKLINNADGTVSFQDVTDYDLVGSNFGAAQLNATNRAVNESFDKGKIIRDLATIRATAVAGYVPDVLALKELDSGLGGFTPVIDSTGKITGYKTKAGADTVFPFKSGGGLIVFTGANIGDDAISATLPINDNTLKDKESFSVSRHYLCE